MSDFPKPTTMVKVFHLLTADDMAIICFHLRQNSLRYSGVHEGLLPFVEVQEVLHTLRMSAEKNAAERPAGRRRLMTIASKIRGGKWDLPQGNVLELDDGKVARRFGPHPERGQPMKWLPLEKVTVGFRNRFGNVEPDDDVHVAPVVALLKIGNGSSRGRWQVNVAEKHRHVVERWLIDNLR